MEMMAPETRKRDFCGVMASCASDGIAEIGGRKRFHDCMRVLCSLLSFTVSWYVNLTVP